MTEEKKYVKDPIPAKAILLGDAFDWAFDEIYAKLAGRYVCPGVWITSLLTMTRFATPIL
jgi:hypothetical protein